MKLIGRYDSPYVRRVGVSLRVLSIPFELIPLSPFSQATEFRQYAAIGRMPALVLDDGETLIDSSMILDYLDELAGPAKALVPNAGPARRKSLQILAAATAACDKAIAINYERRRPVERVFQEWIGRCRTQLAAALRELEGFCGNWPGQGRLMQPEITTACMLGYVRRVEPNVMAHGNYLALERLHHDCEQATAFLACPESGGHAAMLD